jgi:hypothetical protein
MLKLTVEKKGIKAVFTISSPEDISHEEWMEFIHGKTNSLSFYQGNGEGSISVRDGQMTMIAHPSGGGGDVHSEVTVPANPALAELEIALQVAADGGCRFAPKR